MFDHGFFTSKFGHAALVSIAAMITFTVFAEIQHDMTSNGMLLTSAPVVDLA